MAATLGGIFHSLAGFFMAASALPSSFQPRKQARWNTVTNAVLVVPAQKQTLLQIFLRGKIGFSVCASELQMSQHCVCHHLFPFQGTKYSWTGSFKPRKAVRDFQLFRALACVGVF